MQTALGILSNIIQIYSYALIIYILMSWFPNVRETKPGQLLATICEPYLEPFQRFIPPIGMFDISPIVAIITLNLAQQGIYALSGMI